VREREAPAEAESLTGTGGVSIMRLLSCHDNVRRFNDRSAPKGGRVAGRMRELLREMKRGKSKLNAAGFDGQTQAWSGFSSAVRADGALSGKEKALVAVAVGLSKQCAPCVAYYTDAALSLGATRDEVIEAAVIAVLLDGGPAYAHMGLVLEALDELGASA